MKLTILINCLLDKGFFRMPHSVGFQDLVYQKVVRQEDKSVIVLADEDNNTVLLITEVNSRAVDLKILQLKALTLKQFKDELREASTKLKDYA